MADEAVRVEMEHVRRRRWRITEEGGPYSLTVKAWTEAGALRKYRRTPEIDHDHNFRRVDVSDPPATNQETK
jgi:hypothetical protein